MPDLVFGPLEPSRALPHASCWACKAVVAVPCTAGGAPAPLFKCGWCGAISLLQPPPHSIGSEARTSAGVLRFLRRAFVGVIAIVLLSVPALGLTYVLRHLFSGLSLALHVALSLLLSVNINFNFVAAVARHPGPVVFRAPLEGAPIARGSYDNCTFCSTCRAVKPQQAHHCRRCRTCVMDLDHHCIFIDNCVGRANLRHFLLLLAFLVAGCCYTLGLCAALLWQQRPLVARHLQRLLVPIARSGRYWEAALVTPRFLAFAPAWLAATTYLAALTGGSLLGVSLLLASQLRLLCHGRSYLETLLVPATPPRGGEEPREGQGCLDALRRVFGSDHPVHWLRMRWGLPPGLSDAGQKKGM